MKSPYRMRIALSGIPEKEDRAVGKIDETDVLAFRVFPRLFLADKRVFVRGLGFYDREGKGA